MGTFSLGPSSEGFDDREAMDEEANQSNKPPTGSTPKSGLGAGVGESSRGICSASLLEVLNTQSVAHLELPAACASQGAIEFLRTEQNPRQYQNRLQTDIYCLEETHFHLQMQNRAARRVNLHYRTKTARGECQQKSLT